MPKKSGSKRSKSGSKTTTTITKAGSGSGSGSRPGSPVVEVQVEGARDGEDGDEGEDEDGQKLALEVEEMSLGQEREQEGTDERTIEEGRDVVSPQVQPVLEPSTTTSASASTTIEEPSSDPPLELSEPLLHPPPPSQETLPNPSSSTSTPAPAPTTIDERQNGSRPSEIEPDPTTPPRSPTEEERDGGSARMEDGPTSPSGMREGEVEVDTGIPDPDANAHPDPQPHPDLDRDLESNPNPNPDPDHDPSDDPIDEPTPDPSLRIPQLEQDLATMTAQKDHLSTQYRTLLGKLQAMRNSLGEKLKEDAEELDRRESQINSLTSDLTTTHQTLSQAQLELTSLSTENAQLANQLTQLRSTHQAKTEQDSHDVTSLTKELRELRGDLERVRMERDEWELEAGRERGNRENLEHSLRGMERQLIETAGGREKAEKGWRREEERAGRLEEVLSEFQAAKDLEISQATQELEGQLRYAASSLAEYKSRAADAENRLGNLQNVAGRTNKLEKELKEKTAMLGKLRHDAVVMQEHLTEALRRLRRNTSETNVDRRLVTNILLQFITTPRADAKRFEMLSLLATILSWEDSEREKAGLQRVGGPGTPGKLRRKASEMGTSGEGKGKGKEPEPDAYNESFSNLFVEFLLKEAAQGQRHKDPNASPPTHGSPLSPPGSAHPGSPPTERAGPGSTAGSVSGGGGGGMFGFSRTRTMSSASLASTVHTGMKSPPFVGSLGRKSSAYGAGGTLGMNGLGGSGETQGGGLLSPPGGLLSPDMYGNRR